MRKRTVNLILVLGLVILLSFSFVSANIFTDFLGKFNGKVVNVPSMTGNIASSGYWTQWQNRDIPLGVGDLENILNAIQVYPDMCLHPTGIECQTADGKPASSTGQDITCDTTTGFTCFNIDNPGGCLDYRVRFYCGDITKSYNYSQNNPNFLINITSVNGGNPCYFGSSCKILWTYSTTPPANSLLKIEIFKSDGGFELVTQGVPVNGSSSNSYDLVLPLNPSVNQGSYFRVGVSVYNSQTAEIIASQQTNLFFVNISSDLNSGFSEPINPKLHWVDYYSGKELTSVSYPPEELIKAVAENTSIKYTDSSGNSVKRIITIHNKPEKGGLVNSLFSSAKKSSYVSETTPDVWMSFNLESSDVGQTYYFEIDGEPGISPGLRITSGSACADQEGSWCFTSSILRENKCLSNGSLITTNHSCESGVCENNACMPIVGGSCSYDKYPGKCNIVSVSKTDTSKTQINIAGYEGYEVQFNFNPSYDYSNLSSFINKNYLFQLANSWYPGPKYLDKYNLKNGAIFDCNLSLIKEGTCSPSSFEFEGVNSSDYFERNPQFSCPFPTCSDAVDTGKLDSTGCKIYTCPSITGQCSSGCLSDGKCVDIGYRKSGTYCNESGQFTAQYNADEMCDNNFQCGSNLCISGKCISPGFFDKILAWFKNIFG